MDGWRAASRPLGVLLFLTAAIAGCAEHAQVPTDIPNTGTNAESGGCDTDCVLVDGAQPFRVARLRADSVGGVVRLGSAQVLGQRGGIVRIVLDAGAGVWRALPASGVLDVAVDGAHMAEPFTDLAGDGAVVHRFVSGGTVAITVDVARVMPAMGDGPVRLLLRVEGGRVLDAERPWLTRLTWAGDVLKVATGGACAFTAPGTWCGVAVGIAPFWQGTAWSSTGFQSDEGTGPSNTIHITFSQAVEQFAVAVYDPNFPGNQVVAYDAVGGVVTTVSVPGDSMPGKFPPTIEPVIINGLGIRSVDLIPANGDYVGYGEASFTIDPGVHCDTVTRGEVATCQVSQPVDAVLGWQFDGRLVPTVAGQNDSVRVNSASSALTWTGSAVLSGLVSAFVSVADQTDTLTDSLLVLDRRGNAWSWTDGQTWTLRQDQPISCDSSLYGPFLFPAGTRLALNRRTGSCEFFGSIDPSVEVNPDSGFSTAVVQGGPNDGLWYVTSASYYMDRTTTINPFLRANGPTATLTDSTDRAACRHPLHLKKNDSVVVNFFAYNETCRSFSLDSLFTAMLSHEGMGTMDTLNLAVANGHEARRRIVARDTLYDPNRFIEHFVNVDQAHLSQAVFDSVYWADTVISNRANDHGYVNNNYVRPDGTCGKAWVFDTTLARYDSVAFTQANGTCF